VSLAILDPFAGLLALTSTTNALRLHFESDPGLFRLIIISGICNTCLIVYSLYAGVSLWRRVSDAVGTAKKYFRTIFVYSFVSIFLPGLAGISEANRSLIGDVYPLNGLLVMAYACLWYLYLGRSRRVRATFAGGE